MNASQQSGTWPRSGRSALTNIHRLIRFEMAASRAGLLGAIGGIVVAATAGYLGLAESQLQLVRTVAIGTTVASLVLGFVLGMAAEIMIAENQDRDSLHGD